MPLLGNPVCRLGNAKAAEIVRIAVAVSEGTDMERERWIKIGRSSRREHLKLTIEQLKAKWPGRYLFRIEPTPDGHNKAASSYHLFLRHQ